MSAGRKEKSTPGNCSRNFKRKSWTYSSVGRWSCVQRDQNVGIGGAGRRGVAVRKIDAAVGQADVVDDAGYFARRNLFAYEAFDPVAKTRGLFNSRAGPRAQVQLELSGVDPGKEIPSQPGHQEHERAHADRSKAPQERAAVMQAAFQHFVIAVAESFERQLKSDLHPHQRIAAGRYSGGRLPAHGRAADTWPWSAPASEKANKKPAWRTPPPPPAERTDTGRRR